MFGSSRGRTHVRTFLTALLLFLAPHWPAAAATHTYRVGISTDGSAATGCDFSLGVVPPGSLPGFELQVTVVVDDDPIPPQATTAAVEACNGAVGADPPPLDGFVVELDGGLLAADSLIGAIPLSLLEGAVAVRLAFHAMAAPADGAATMAGPSTSEDALFTVNGSSDGAPIVLLIDTASPAPVLSGLGLALALIVLSAIAWRRYRRGRWVQSLGIAASIVVGAAITYAAFGDPVAVDDPDDATGPAPQAEIIAGFAMLGDDELGLRLDIEDFPFEVECADGVDNDGDGAIDCEDGNCAGRQCNDQNGCTTGEICSPSFEGEGLVCLGAAVDCSAIVGNECAISTCRDLGPELFSCSSELDLSKSAFGSCVAAANCAVPRNPDGTCPEVVDECRVGRCVEQAGTPPAFVCVDESKLDVGVEEGGCSDGNDCTVDMCAAGLCSYSDLDAVGCDDGNDCTTDVCVQGVCQGMPSDGMCDDGNPCTDDSCDSGNCVGTPNNDNPCNDENDCTSSDACSSGVCSGVPVSDGMTCDDGSECAIAVCSQGVCDFQDVDDGECVTDDNPCTQQFCSFPGACGVTLVTGVVECQVDNGNCLLGLQSCSNGTAVGGCVAIDPPQPCP